MRFVLTMMLIGTIGCDAAVHRDSLFTDLSYIDTGYDPRTPGDFEGSLLIDTTSCRLLGGLSAPPCEPSVNSLLAANRNVTCGPDTIVTVEAFLDVEALDFVGDFTINQNIARPLPGEAAMRLEVNGATSVSTKGVANVRSYPALGDLVEVIFNATMIDETTKKPADPISGTVFCKMPKKSTP